MKPWLHWLLLAVLAGALAGCTINDQGNDAVQKLSAVSLADIDQATAFATLNQDAPALQCLAAIRVVVAGIQSWQKPVVGPVTAFQMGMDITNPQGYLNANCAAERAQVKARVQLFMGQAATIAATFGL